jgi:hypothetical protein
MKCEREEYMGKKDTFNAAAILDLKMADNFL